MKKLLATLTTVAMLATTTSAFAAPVANDKGYNKAAGTYSVAADLRDVEGQLTLLIIPEAAYLADAIEDADILYIDQGAYADGLFQSVGILGGTTLADGTYYAKIGGKGLDEIIVEKFTIASAPTYTLGDIDGNEDVDILDANLAVKYCAELVTFTETQSLAADVDGNEDVDILDANLIVKYCAELITSFPAAK